jgi:ERCC4-type nuclease
MIIVDSREPNHIKNSLKAKGVEVKENLLQVGDYLLDDGY